MVGSLRTICLVRVSHRHDPQSMLCSNALQHPAPMGDRGLDTSSEASSYKKLLLAQGASWAAASTQQWGAKFNHAPPAMRPLGSIISSARRVLHVSPKVAACCAHHGLMSGTPCLTNGTQPPWPNGQGVGLPIRRLRARVPQGVYCHAGKHHSHAALQHEPSLREAVPISPEPLYRWARMECFVKPHWLAAIVSRLAEQTSYEPCRAPPMATPAEMDTLGIEPRASRMLSGCDTATPCALGGRAFDSKRLVSSCGFRLWRGRSGFRLCLPCFA